MVRTRPLHCGGLGSIPGWGTKTPQAVVRPKKKKRKEVYNSSVSHIELEGAVTGTQSLREKVGPC